MNPSDSNHTEIAFFDVETSIPSRVGQGYALLEFGAILVCPQKLVEVDSYETLIKPDDLSVVSVASVKCNGITREKVSCAPRFGDVADKVFDLLHGRVWAGHNIIRFDCVRIREAFAAIGRPAPEPKGTIDSLSLLTQKFGRRAGNMKMATLATYFGLGNQTHRSLDDVRMNLEVLKYCATVLFLESSLPEILLATNSPSPNTNRRTRSNKKASIGEISDNTNSPASIFTFANNQPLSPLSDNVESDVRTSTKPNTEKPDPFNMAQLIDEMTVIPDTTMEERPVFESSEVCSSYGGFLEPDEVSIPSISACLVPYYHGSRRIQLVHKNVILLLCSAKLKVRFGVSSKFVNNAGRPRLSIVVDPSPGLTSVLDACDNVAERMYVESGSISEWRPVVMRKNNFLNIANIRLHIPTVANGDVVMYSTEMYRKEASGNNQKIIFSKVDASELDSLFVPGTLIDASFSLDLYDYQDYAGIRLVAKKLTL